MLLCRYTRRWSDWGHIWPLKGKKGLMCAITMLLYRYGVRATTEECPFAVFLQSVQSIVGVIIQVTVHWRNYVVIGNFRIWFHTPCFCLNGTGGYKEMLSILVDQWRPRIWAQMRGKGGGGGSGVSANEYSCAHGAQINFGYLTPYLFNGVGPQIGLSS